MIFNFIRKQKLKSKLRTLKGSLGQMMIKVNWDKSKLTEDELKEYKRLCIIISDIEECLK